jgi:uncharacterized membrane protein
MLGFFVPGICLILFSYGIFEEFRETRTVKPACILIAVAGMTYIGEALFSCDAGCIPVTPPGYLHLWIGTVVAVVAVLSAFAISYPMYRSARWNGFWQYSMLTGIFLIFLIPLYNAMPGIVGISRGLSSLRSLSGWRSLPSGCIQVSGLQILRHRRKKVEIQGNNGCPGLINTPSPLPWKMMKSVM